MSLEDGPKRSSESWISDPTRNEKRMRSAYCALRRAPGMDGWALSIACTARAEQRQLLQIGTSLWISDWFVLGITEGGGSHELGALYVLVVSPTSLLGF